MVKDYFQDILPPSNGPFQKAPPKPAPKQETPPPPPPSQGGESAPGERSIRNIAVTSRAPRRAPPPPPTPPSQKPPRRFGPRMFIWIAAIVSLVIVGLIFLVAFRPTSIRVIPRSQVVSFDSSVSFTAYPADTVATGTLPYTVQMTDLEDSAVVEAKGVEHVEEKATGTLTVVNNYSTSPVTLVKNTRFETPDGLVFRIASEIKVPGKSGTRPGEISVTVTADEAGEEYNVGPTAKFTLPGLKSNPTMYAGVTARSSEAMKGGFSGDRPAVAPATLDAAKAEIRGRLETQVRSTIDQYATNGNVVLPDLVQISYTSLPYTSEANGSVRIHEKAHVIIPVFPAVKFAQQVSRGVSADAEDSNVSISNVESLTAHYASENDSAVGTGPLYFSLEGMGQLVWAVDTGELTSALAGKDQAAFQAIVAAFPGIDEAYARIQPFWKGTFPEDPYAIQVEIEPVPKPGS